MLKNKRLLIVAIIACIFSSLGAQTNSPYSRYGYGVLKDQTTGISKGMGGARYGIRNSLSPNAGNPASYSAVDSITFLFDMGVYLENAKLSDPAGSRTDWNGGLNYITMLFPLSKKLGISTGILPITSVGYDYGTEDYQGNVKFQKSYDGSGGFSQAYVGLGYELPIKGLSLGFNASYVFGKIKHRSSLALGGQSGSTEKNIELRVNSYKFDIGVQYDFMLNKNNSMTFGAVYTPKINSTGTYKRFESKTVGLSPDTTLISGANAGMPHKVGAGIAWKHQRRWTVAADFTYENWKGVKYEQAMGDNVKKKDRFNDTWKVNLGGEFVNKVFSRKFLDKTRLRAGVNFGNSYLNIPNSTGTGVGGYNEYGATFGFGFPIYDSGGMGARTSYINLNFEYKLLDPKLNGMVKEQYFGLSLSISFNERWFHKIKVQ